MSIYQKLKNYYNNCDFEELESRPNSCTFFDSENEECTTINDMNELNLNSLIYKNDMLKIVDEKKFIDTLSVIDKNFFTFVEEVIFVINDSDIEYLEEYYCVELNENYLGQYNSENSIIIINVIGILDRAYSILEEENLINEYTLNNFTSEEILITVIHELFHNILDKDKSNSLHEILPFNLNEVHDEEVEEIIVERFAKKIVSASTSKLTLFNESFITKYLKKIR